MEVIDDTTQLKTDDQIEAETKEFEFLVPLHSLVKLRPFVDRYFIKYYKTFPSVSDPAATNNQYAFCHTNKLFMIGIANEHEIVTKKMKIKQISFDKLDKEAGLAVKGKKKSIGGLKVKTGEKIAEIVTEDGKVFPLFSLVDGNVIEINEAIEKDPNIILTEAEAKGYIAIINSGLKIERYVSKLTPEQEYRALVDRKETKTTEPMVEEKPSK